MPGDAPDLAGWLDGTPDFVITLDGQGHVTATNPAARQLMTIDEVMPARALDVAARHGSWTGDTRLLCRDGRILDVSAVVVAHPAAGGGPPASFTVVCRDVSRQKEHEAFLQRLAERDPLTGLLNRHVLRSHLDKAVASAHRGRASGLLYLDLDRMKRVNDLFDHSAGDRYLAQVASTLQAGIRAEDVLARLGGDEFVVLVRSETVEHVLKVADALRQRVSAVRVDEGGRSLTGSVSVGVAMVDGSAEGDDVLAWADRACYAAKARGRDRVELYVPGATELARGLGDAGWLTEIGGVGEQRLRFALQPIVRLDTGEVARHEMLVRFVGDTGDVLAPAPLLQLADRYGVTGMIDELVVAAALEQLGDGPRSVNLSPLGLVGGRIADLVAEGSPSPGALTFELSEATATTHLPEAMAFAARVRAAGCRVAIDDFGVGLSPYAYLRHLEVDEIKLDSSFATGDANRKLAGAAVALAHAMGIEVVAKGIESGEMLDAVRALGADLGQGFHLGAPALSGSA